MKYGAILADPAWRFKTWSNKNQTRSASNHYRTMTLAEIKALPVLDYAADDCALFLWGINTMVPETLQTIEAWGFTFKTIVFDWAKRTKRGKWHFGMGYWSRQNTELVYLATRGKPKRLARNVRQLIEAQVREHSRKPDEIYPRIEALVAGPYLELFARQRYPGWDVAYSDECNKFTPPLAA